MIPGAAVISLITGLEDPEKVTVAMLVAVGAAEAGRETLMFLTKEAVRLVLPGHAVGVACEGCPHFHRWSSGLRRPVDDSSSARSASTHGNSISVWPQPMQPSADPFNSGSGSVIVP
jgi:hypothetical protein